MLELVWGRKVKNWVPNCLSSNWTINVYDTRGIEVAELANTNQEAGSYDINFDASNLSSGLYIYTLNTGNFTSSKKMMLLK